MAVLKRSCPQNFLALCASGYYDSCIWHRNIKGFMMSVPPRILPFVSD